MNVKKVETLLKVFEKSKIQGLTVQDEEGTIQLKRKMSRPLAPTHTAPKIETNAVADLPLVPAHIELKSESVGIFYPKVSPDEIAHGARVPRGREVFSIKAMNIESLKKLDFDCRVVRYLVEEGKAVEYGQGIALVDEF
jgi:acetyl-CoA carboxylase biotin carboxyl carrier protein